MDEEEEVAVSETLTDVQNNKEGKDNPSSHDPENVAENNLPEQVGQGTGTQQELQEPDYENYNYIITSDNEMINFDVYSETSSEASEREHSISPYKHDDTRGTQRSFLTAPSRSQSLPCVLSLPSLFDQDTVEWRRRYHSRLPSTESARERKLLREKLHNEKSVERILDPLASTSVEVAAPTTPRAFSESVHTTLTNESIKTTQSLTHSKSLPCVLRSPQGAGMSLRRVKRYMPSSSPAYADWRLRDELEDEEPVQKTLDPWPGLVKLPWRDNAKVAHERKRFSLFYRDMRTTRQSAAIHSKSLPCVLGSPLKHRGHSLVLSESTRERRLLNSKTARVRSGTRSFSNIRAASDQLMYSDIRTLSAPELRVRFSTHDIDIETHEEILPSYARLTYDASRMPPIVEQTVLGHLESLEDEVSTQPVDLRSRVSGDDEEVGQRAAQYHGLSGTVFKHIPLREEFRVRRLWLFHHDIRAFTTSWIPLPLFLAYRILILLYVFISLTLQLENRSGRFGPHWLIFFTNLAYITLLVTVGAQALMCVVYTIVLYKRPRWLQKYLPKHEAEERRVFSQSNIPWLVMPVWCLLIVSSTLGFVAFGGYWGCHIVQSTSGSVTCGTPDFHSVQVHGLNIFVILLDLFLSRTPYQLLHFFYPSIFALLYIVFTLIYWAAGGLNHDGKPYIYTVFDYEANPKNGGIAVGFVLCPMVVYVVVLFLPARLRDVLCAAMSRYRARRKERRQTETRT